VVGVETPIGDAQLVLYRMSPLTTIQVR
jgi:hypothetical protein